MPCDISRILFISIYFSIKAQICQQTTYRSQGRLSGNSWLRKVHRISIFFAYGASPLRSPMRDGAKRNPGLPCCYVQYRWFRFAPSNPQYYVTAAEKQGHLSRCSVMFSRRCISGTVTYPDLIQVGGLLYIKDQHIRLTVTKNTDSKGRGALVALKDFH